MGPSRRVPERARDVETATLRYLVYGLLPAWFVPGLLDWALHRRTDIEHTAGVQESLIHALMMTEVGVPIAIALVCEVNPLVLTIIVAAILAHEATALWDVTTAEESGREVRPVEQHVHSFLEAMPFMAGGALACLHWEQIQALARGARDRRAWTLRLKRPSLPPRYLAGVGGAILGLIALPYGEELVRCLRARRRGSATATA
ncbi:diguanylate cyclase/phosphodiesterase [Actinoalloteichus sp. AHMU CJ021]|nr:diguanylate cyclase/phosphodiesterase [Actinoalloteichus sp. AHMU CJ021]